MTADRKQAVVTMDEAMDEDGGTGLPASIEAAWGLRERPTKGPKRGLSLHRIVEAAVKVAEADGLPAVSMSRVAAELGASTMSLYRYVSAKDELLALMLDAATPPPPDTVAEGGWRGGLSRWGWNELAALRRSPWALHIPVSGPPATPNQIAWLEQGLRCLHDTGLAEGEKLSVILLVSGYVWRYATLEADMSAAARTAGSTSPPTAVFGRALAKLTDPQRFPALHRLIEAGVFDEPDDLDAEFSFGFERVLDGIDVLIRSRTGQPR
jgi:AcrR family transcriptional regulator